MKCSGCMQTLSIDGVATISITVKVDGELVERVTLLNLHRGCARRRAEHRARRLVKLYRLRPGVEVAIV